MPKHILIYTRLHLPMSIHIILYTHSCAVLHRFSHEFIYVGQHVIATQSDESFDIIPSPCTCTVYPSWGILVRYPCCCQECVYVYMYVSVYVCVCVCMCVYVSVCASVCMYLGVYVCVWMCTLNVNVYRYIECECVQVH